MSKLLELRIIIFFINNWNCIYQPKTGYKDLITNFDSNKNSQFKLFLTIICSTQIPDAFWIHNAQESIVILNHWQ